VRQFPLEAGAKAILAHVTRPKKEFEYYFFVMSGSKKIAWPKVKEFIGTKKVRFAKLDEVKDITGCLTGAVPPFGSQFKGGLKTYVDPSLRKQGDVITFNVGLRTHSIIMKYDDWV
jgi:Ala-tRNA(Pro) deacylase